MVKIDINGVREVVATDSTGTLAVLSSGDVVADIRTMIGIAEVRRWDYVLDEQVERHFVAPAFRETKALALDARPEYAGKSVSVDYAVDTGFEVRIEETRIFWTITIEDTLHLAEQLAAREGAKYYIGEYAASPMVAEKILEGGPAELTDAFISRMIDEVLPPDRRYNVDAESVIEALESRVRFDAEIYDILGKKDGLLLTKCCSKCGESKPLDEFYAQKDGKYGRRADCIECKRSGARKCGAAADNVISLESARHSKVDADLAVLTN